MGLQKLQRTHPYGGIHSESINKIQSQHTGQNPELTAPPCDPTIRSKATICKGRRCIPPTLERRNKICPSCCRDSPILCESSQHHHHHGTQLNRNQTSKPNTRDDEEGEAIVRLLCHTKGCNNNIQRKQNDIGNSQRCRVLQ